MAGPIKVTSAHPWSIGTTTIPWGHKPSGALWSRVELDRGPETPKEEAWLRDEIRVRLTPDGVITTAVDGR